MPTCTVKWTCPICGASKTALRYNIRSGDADPRQKAASGLLGHIRQMTDEDHGGRGRYPRGQAWRDGLADSCVTVAPVSVADSTPDFSDA